MRIYESKSYHKGPYSPTNKEKYVGKKAPFFRSKWELEVFKWFDLNQNVLKWASEPLEIQYIYSLDGKTHRYIPDFYAEIKDVHGKITKYILEVKPKKKITPPKPQKKRTAKSDALYINRVREYTMIMDKKKAAEEFCKRHGFVFLFLTEENIFNR